MSVIIPQESGRSTTVERPAAAYSISAQETAWKVLGWLGIAFFIMSLFDIVVGWYPARFGTPEWEFGTISATINGLSIPCLALYLVLCSGIARERPALAKAAGIAMAVMALILPALVILYLTNVPIALNATLANALAHAGIKKAVVKSLIFFTGYEVLFVVGALKAFRGRTKALKGRAGKGSTV